MKITDEVSTFLNKYVHTTDEFSPLYLPAWCICTWIPFPFIPALYVQGSGRNTFIQALCHISPEFHILHSVKGPTITPTILLDPPEVWSQNFFVLTAESKGIEPVYDRDLYLRIGRWIKANGSAVQEVYWYLLEGKPPDALAPMTAVLLCVEEQASFRASLSASAPQDVSVSEPEQEIAPDARESELNHEG